MGPTLQLHFSLDSIASVSWGAKRLPKGLLTIVIFARVWAFPNFMRWLVASQAYVTEVAESQFTAAVVEFPTDWSGSGVWLVSPRTGTLS